MTETPLEIPSGPEALNTAWLTDVLRRNSAVADAAVSSFSSTLVERQGAAGVVVRVALEYDRNEPGAPATIIAKFATPYEPLRRLLHAFGGYRTEIEFYRQLGADAGIPTPRCFHADIDLASGFFVLLLEDMQGSRVGDPLTPSPEDTELAIEHLAPFHAKWWKSEGLQALTWLAQPGTAEFATRVAQAREAFARAVPAIRQRFGDDFPAILSAVCESVLTNWDKALARRIDAPTLIHRDFHSQQMFFPSNGGGRFVVFDWQTVGVGRGADDLARIVAMGLSRSQREKHERRLIELYYSGLRANGVVDYELDHCFDDFRLGLTSSLLINVVAAANVDLDLLAQRAAELGVTRNDLVEVLFGRLAAAVETHDVLSLLNAM